MKKTVTIPVILSIILWITGGILIFVGGPKSISARLGATICFLVIFGFFGFLSINFIFASIYSITRSYRQKLKMEWLKWIAVIIATGFFTGITLMVAWLIIGVWLR